MGFRGKLERRSRHRLSPRLENLEPRALLATFTVTVTDDSGAGSLRDAIRQANLTPASDDVVFASNVQEIKPSTPYEDLKFPVRILGNAKPGDTKTVAINGDNQITGFVLSGGGSTIQGLKLTNFKGYAIALKSNSNVIQANEISSTKSDAGNPERGDGILVEGSNNLIGGVDPLAGNTIISNAAAGVRLVSVNVAGSINNTILSNSMSKNTKGGIIADSKSNGSFLPPAPNRGIAPPTLTRAFVSTINGVSTTFVEGLVNGQPSSSYRLQFFLASVSTDNVVEGEKLVNLVPFTVTTDGAGQAVFQFQITSDLKDSRITATSTDVAGNTSVFSTSAVTVLPRNTSDVAVFLTDVTTGADEQAGQRTVKASLVNGGPDPIASIDLEVVARPSAQVVSAQNSTNAPYTLLSNGVVSTLKNLAPGASNETTLTVKVPQGVSTSFEASARNFVEFDPLLANNVAVLGDSDANGPQVSTLKLNVGTDRIESLNVTFSELLTPETAVNRLNYRLRLRGPDGVFGTGDDQDFPIRAVQYSPSTRSVLVVPGGRGLRLGQFYQFVINPPRSPGVTDLSGNLLDGDTNGRPDGQYLALIGRGTHIRPSNLPPNNPTTARSGLLGSLLRSSGLRI